MNTKKQQNHKLKIMVYISALLAMGIYFSCAENFDDERQEPLVFENPNPIAKTDLDLGADESSNFTFHRIYNYSWDGINPFPFISAWSSYFDPGIVDTGFPLYIWEHPFYTNAFLWDAWGWNDDGDDDDDHRRHRNRHKHHGFDR